MAVQKFDYLEVQNDAAELISEFGQNAVLRRVGKDDPNDWQSSGSAPTDYAVTIVLLPATSGKFDNFDIKFDESFVVQQARFGYMAVQMSKLSGDGDETVMPMPLDILTVGNEEMTIITSRSLNPAGTAVYYSFAARV